MLFESSEDGEILYLPSSPNGGAVPPSASDGLSDVCHSRRTNFAGEAALVSFLAPVLMQVCERPCFARRRLGAGRPAAVKTAPPLARLALCVPLVALDCNEPSTTAGTKKAEIQGF